MQMTIKITEQEAKEILVAYLMEKTAQPLDPKDVVFEVKSKQNYKSEWEQAQFRASYIGEVK